MDIVTYALLNEKIKDYASNVDEWLEENVDPDTGYVLDRSLQMENAAAPADMVGDINDEVGDLKNTLNTLGEEDFLKCTISDQTGYYSRFTVCIPVNQAITNVDIEFDLNTELNISELFAKLYIDDTDDPTTRGTAYQIGTASLTNNHIHFANDFANLDNKTFAKIYFNITVPVSSQNGVVRFDNLKIKINGKRAESAHVYQWNTGVTLTFEYKITGVPAYASKAEIDLLGISNTTEPVIRSNVNTSIITGGDVVYYGIRVPIQPLKNITGIVLKNIFPIPTGQINCAILDSSLNVLASSSNSYDNVGATGSVIQFHFENQVTISTDYGFLEIDRPNSLLLNYNTLTAEQINADIAVVPTDSVRGYVHGNSGWLRVTKSQSFQFNLVYDVVCTLPYTETNMDAYQNPIIKWLSDRIDAVECGPGKRYQRLRDAIEKGCETGGVVVVYPATYDLTAEFSEELAAHTARGISLYNGVHVIFMAGAYVTAYLDGSDSEEHSLFAPFQVQGSCTIEGLHVRVTNTRYCVHDEMQGNGTYHVKYIDCDMECINGTETPTFVQCIGGGLGRHGFIEIDGGKYRSFNSFTDSSNVPAISYHNGSYASCDSKIHIKNVYLAEQNYFRFGNYGTSTIKTPVYVSGCSMGDNILLTNESQEYSTLNFEITEWNNTVRSI